MEVIGGLNRAHIEAHTRIDQITYRQSNRNSQSCSRQIKYQCSHTYGSKLLGITDGHTSADKGTEYQRYNQHFHQTDKSLSDHIKDSLHDHIFLEAAVRNQVTENDSQYCTCDQRHKDLRGKAHFLFLLCFLFYIFLFHSSPPLFHPYILSAMLSSPACHTLQ